MRTRLLKKLLCSALTLTLSVTSMGMVTLAFEGEAPADAKEEALGEVVSGESEEIADELMEEVIEDAAESDVEDEDEDAAGDADEEFFEESEESDTWPEELPEGEASTLLSIEAGEASKKGADGIGSSLDIEFPEGFVGMVGYDAEVDDDSFDRSYAKGSSLFAVASGTFMADIQGIYYTLPAESILEEINRIRLEACKEHIVVNGKELTENDYYPLKWSATIEKAARKRVMEAAMTVEHSRLDGGNIFEYYKSGTEGFRGGAENLAWNNNHNSYGITYGLKQFYDEKADYIREQNGQSHGVTGHYKSLINPNYRYVAVSGCQMSGNPKGWFTVAMEFGGPASRYVDETQDMSTGVQVQTLGVTSSYVTSLTMAGETSLKTGESAEYELSGKASIPNDYATSTLSFYIPAGEERGVSWTSSDDTVAEVYDGVVTGISGGKADISATLGDKTAKKSISVANVLTGIKLNTESATLDFATAETPTLQLTCQPVPEDVDISVSYTSSDPKVATVDAKGLVTAVSAGTAVITATAGGFSAECVIEVIEPEPIPEVIESDVIEGDEPYKGDDPEGVWLAAVTFKDSFVYTGEKHVQEGLRIYNDKKLLVENTDYTISYKNNINAAASGSTNAPEMIVTLKGNYQGSKSYYFNILPADINDAQTVSQFALEYTGTAQYPVPEITFAGKKLVNNTDFTCEYPDSDYSVTATPLQIVIKGKGNFAGQRTVRFTITPASKKLDNATVTIASKANPRSRTIEFGTGLSPQDLQVMVKIDGAVINSDYYEITSLPDKPGKGYVVIEATELGIANGVAGSKTVSITTVAASIRNATVAGFVSSMQYDLTEITAHGGMTQSAVTLKYGSKILTEGVDYTASYSANTKVGTAKVTYTGIGIFTGSLAKSYKITAYKKALNVDYESSYAYIKGGVTPTVSVTDINGNKLTSGTDYSVSIISSSNTKAGTMRFKVVGKNNFYGASSSELRATITKGDIGKATMTLSDKAYVSRGTGWKSTVKVTDINGKALAAGTDYEKTITYTYDGMNTKSVPDAGTTVYVTVVGKNNYAGSSLTGSYRIYGTSISRYSVVVKTMEYTGDEIEPKEGTEIHVYPTAKDAKAGTNEVDPDLYEVVSYSANVKPGTGKVTIKGLGLFGGTKTGSFKILKPSKSK